MSSPQRRRRAAHSGSEGPTGGEHPDVVQMQRLLRRFGYLGEDEAVRAGRLDRPTAAALRRYQRQRQIPQTGDFDAATRAELNQPDKTYRVAVHEIGHTLGLDHYKPPRRRTARRRSGR